MTKDTQTISFQQWGNTNAQQQILFIHGWGMNSGVWVDVAEYLQQNYPEYLIRAVDLPGYGHSADYDLDGVYNSQTLAHHLEPQNMIQVSFYASNLHKIN